MNIPIGLKEVAVLCILRSEAGFLLLRRKKQPNLNKYTPLGGHLEPFESPKAAAIREVREEAGISLDDLCLRGIMTETSPTKYNWINYIFTADVPVTPFVNGIEGTLEWVPQERLASIPTPTTDRYIYEYIARSEFFAFDAIYDDNEGLVSLVDEVSGRIVFNRQ